MHCTIAEVASQVAQVLHLTCRQARRAHLGRIQLQHSLRLHAVGFALRRQHKTLPHRLSGLDRYLLTHNGPRQGRESVTATLQTGLTKLRNQLAHDAVAFGQMLASVIPIAGGDLWSHRVSACFGLAACGHQTFVQVVPCGESCNTTPWLSNSLRI